MTPQDIIRFWIDETGANGWYIQSASLDDTIRARFLPAWEDAEALTSGWLDSPEGVLAALILTDQFPRNMFRNDARAFATDPLALRIANAAIARDLHRSVPPPAQQFFFLPLEHSEDIADQERAVTLFAEFMPGESLTHAQLHHATIRCFGRFPWRNAVLGRESSPEEQALLEAGGYGALVTGAVSLDGMEKSV